MVYPVRPRVSSTAHEGDREVFVPGLPVARQLPQAGDHVAVQLADEVLREARMVARQRPLVVADGHPVDAMDAARVEVVHRQLAALGGADDRDRVGGVRMVVARAVDQELLALEPLERRLAADHAVEHRVRGLDRPGAHEGVQRVSHSAGWSGR